MDPDKLESLATALRTRLRQLIEAGDIPIEPARKDGVRGPDEDEQPLTEMSQVLASGRNRIRTQELAQVERALQRLAADPEMFGLCETCEEPIALPRLTAMPWARFCVRCQASHDGPRGGTRKHITDYR